MLPSRLKPRSFLVLTPRITCPPLIGSAPCAASSGASRFSAWRISERSRFSRTFVSVIQSRNPVIVWQSAGRSPATTSVPVLTMRPTNWVPASISNSHCPDWKENAVPGRPLPAATSLHSRNCICGTTVGERSIFAPVQIVRRRWRSPPRYCSTCLMGGGYRRLVSTIWVVFSPPRRRQVTNCASTTTRSISSQAAAMRRVAPRR